MGHLHKKHLRRFVRLPATERRLVVKAALLLGTMRLGLWLLPFQTLRRIHVGMMRAPIRVWDKEHSSRESVIWAVETAGRRMPRAATCLTLALTAQVLLLRRGYPALLRIGADKGGTEGFVAHAWVESGGTVVIGDHELERYIPLVSLQGERM
jgi:hypothetical protein